MVISSLPTTSITTLPWLNLLAVSSDEYSLLLIPSLITSLSIITDTLCFLFFSNSKSIVSSFISPSTFILIYPSFLSFSNKSFWVPFSPLTTGDITIILVFSSSSKILLVISSIDWDEIGIWWFGQWGTPTLANNSLR